MADINFYHLLSTSLEKAIPKLMEKIIQIPAKAVIIAKSEEQVKLIDELLWTYSTRAFLPHGTCFDKFKEKQHIYITQKLENPNNASMIIITNGMILDKPDEYEKCLDIFDGNDPEELALARERWSKYKDNNHIMTYWQQQATGAWVKG